MPRADGEMAFTSVALAELLSLPLAPKVWKMRWLAPIR